jgi:hypothetical protein
VFVDSEAATNCQIMPTVGRTVCGWHDPGRYDDPDGDVGYCYRHRHLNIRLKLSRYAKIELTFL